MAAQTVETLLEDKIALGLTRTETCQTGDAYPELTPGRRKESLAEPVHIEESQADTVLYLAYGSNLCDETFLGRRGIRPLSATNVVVPELRLTFDLPGLPYSEPCFANTGRRDHKESFASFDYHKDRWVKGLVGVVYEVTKEDYRTIIATEGGGSSYHDILVDCYPLSSDQHEPVPMIPKSTSFKSHTLFAPADPAERPQGVDDPLRRPDSSYAQASARYLKLITDGAKQRRLPYEYQRFLEDIRPYTITEPRQRLGKFISGLVWIPFLVLIFALSRQFSDDQGRAPYWCRWLTSAVFRGVWYTYDHLFKPIFGDGERTMSNSDPDRDLRLADQKEPLMPTASQERNS